MILTVVSPDKLSISMFMDFFKTIYLSDKNHVIHDLISLYSDQIQTEIIKGFRKEYPETTWVLIKYKLKKLDPNKYVVPEYIKENSDYLLKFDRYSTEPEIIKPLDDNFFTEVTQRWKKNIEKFNNN